MWHHLWQLSMTAILTLLRVNKPKEVTFWWPSISGDGNLASDWLTTLWTTSLLSVYMIFQRFCLPADQHFKHWWRRADTLDAVQTEEVVKWWLQGCAGTGCFNGRRTPLLCFCPSACFHSGIYYFKFLSSKGPIGEISWQNHFSGVAWSMDVLSGCKLNLCTFFCMKLNVGDLPVGVAKTKISASVPLSSEKQISRDIK